MKTGLLSLITSLHLNRLCTFLITQSRAASLSSAAGLYFISLRLALPPCLAPFHLSHLFLFVVVVFILAVVCLLLFSHVAALWRARRGGRVSNLDASWSSPSNTKCHVEVCGTCYKKVLLHEKHFNQNLFWKDKQNRPFAEPLYQKQHNYKCFLSGVFCKQYIQHNTSSERPWLS